MAKKSGFQAIFEGKCPRCRTGNMFSDSALNLKKFAKMNDSCIPCGLRYQVEPGFFYGAMYVSYAISVAIMMTTFIFLFNFAGDPSLSVYVFAVTIVSVITYPLNFRYSRIIFLHFFGGIDYEPSRIKN